MAHRALRMSPVDDVATLIEAAAAGDEVAVETKQGEPVCVVTATADVPRFHKVCIKAFSTGDKVHKYGEIIGVATASAEPGDYVHIHNIESIKTGVRR